MRKGPRGVRGCNSNSIVIVMVVWVTKQNKRELIRRPSVSFLYFRDNTLQITPENRRELASESGFGSERNYEVTTVVTS